MPRDLAMLGTTVGRRRRRGSLQIVVRDVGALQIVILMVATTITACCVGPDCTLADVIFECVSAQSTVGLSSGITDPSMPVAVELVFILQMWAGRLEIFLVIIVFAALFARARRR